MKGDDVMYRRRNLRELEEFDKSDPLASLTQDDRNTIVAASKILGTETRHNDAKLESKHFISDPYLWKGVVGGPGIAMQLTDPAQQGGIDGQCILYARCIVLSEAFHRGMDVVFAGVPGCTVFHATMKQSTRAVSVRDTLPWKQMYLGWVTLSKRLLTHPCAFAHGRILQYSIVARWRSCVDEMLTEFQPCLCTDRQGKGQSRRIPTEVVFLVSPQRHITRHGQLQERGCPPRSVQTASRRIPSRGGQEPPHQINACGLLGRAISYSGVRHCLHLGGSRFNVPEGGGGGGSMFHWGRLSVNQEVWPAPFPHTRIGTFSLAFFFKSSKVACVRVD